MTVGTGLAARHGIKNGDMVRSTTPGGTLESVAVVRGGVAPKTVAIEHGFGHRGFGASNITIDDETWPAEEIGIPMGLTPHKALNAAPSQDASSILPTSAGTPWT
ncbi:MAG: molybdopterin dinucleotide binding domain-containing protein [Paracoccaceae bacterium]